MGNCLFGQWKPMDVKKTNESLIHYNPQVMVHPMLPSFSSHEISNKYRHPNCQTMVARPLEKVRFSDDIGDEESRAGGAVRIKLVIRKQELQEMLGEDRVSFPNMVSEVQRALDSNKIGNIETGDRKWFPSLKSIPEVN